MKRRAERPLFERARGIIRLPERLRGKGHEHWGGGGRKIETENVAIRWRHSTYEGSSKKGGLGCLRIKRREKLRPERFVFEYKAPESISDERREEGRERRGGEKDCRKYIGGRKRRKGRRGSVCVG